MNPAWFCELHYVAQLIPEVVDINIASLFNKNSFSFSENKISYQPNKHGSAIEKPNEMATFAAESRILQKTCSAVEKGKFKNK